MATISEFWDQTFSWVGTRETENNAYAKFWGVKQRALWYVMGFWSGQLHNLLGEAKRNY